MIVLDCCAAVEIVRGSTEGKALRSPMLQGEKIISSELLCIELASAFGKYVRAHKMRKAEALLCIQDAIALVDEFVSLEESYVEAFNEALRLKHSVYDMLYIVAARRNAATLMTLDAKLLTLCEEQGIDYVRTTAV